MADIVKESLDIYIHYIVQPVKLHLAVYLCYCMALVSIGTKAIAMLMGFCFADRFQYL